MFRCDHARRRFCDEECRFLCGRTFLAVRAAGLGPGSFERDGATGQRGLSDLGRQAGAGSFEHWEFSEGLRSEVSRESLSDGDACGVGGDVCLVDSPSSTLNEAAFQAGDSG